VRLTEKLSEEDANKKWPTGIEWPHDP